MSDIKIRIGTEYDDKGAKEAKKDKEELERPSPSAPNQTPSNPAPQPATPKPPGATAPASTPAQPSAPAPSPAPNRPGNNGGRGSLATLPPDLDASAPAAAEDARAVARRNKALITDAEEDLAKARATGANASTINDLESQVREQKLKARFMREQGLGEEDALSKAQNLVALQNEGRARKQAAQDQAREERASARQNIEEQKRADRDRRDEERREARSQRDEERQQATVDKARTSFIRRAGGAGLGLASEASGGLGGIGQLGGTLMQAGAAGGPIGEAIAAVVTGIAATVAIGQERQHNERLRALEAQGNREISDRAFQRAGTFEGSAAGSRAAAEAEIDQQTALNKERREVEEQTRARWYNPATWNLTGSRDRKLGGIDDKIAQSKTDEARYREQAANFARDTTLHEIAQQKKSAAGDMAGARAEQQYMAVYDYYRKLKSGGATDSEATEGAQAYGQNLGREQAGKLAGLVSARDGVTDTAAVAREAAAVRSHSNAAVVEAINNAAKLSQDHHAQAMGAITRRNFSRP